MRIFEASADESVISKLIDLSVDWEKEGSCYGYRANTREDIDGNRIFLAEENGDFAGYLFGHMERSERASSIMPDGTPYFEVEELYVVPEYRRQGVGSALFRFAESAVKSEAEFIMLSTAVKNYKSIFSFYLDELGMEFWSARLFKKL